jgi:6-phosphogluconolactonase
VSPPAIVICRDPDALARSAAARFIAAGTEAYALHGRFAVALSGGSTPKMMYALLAGPEFSNELDWARVDVFWGDERCVPPDHPESNFRMAKEALLDKIAVPPANVHRMRAEEAPGPAADAYENEIKRFFALQSGQLPRFDLVLLGLGEDGHTASLFPGSRVLDERDRLVAAPYAEKLQAHRLTLTLPVINAAARVIFLVAGASKAKVVGEILQAGKPADRYPAARVRPANGDVTWLIDAAAAAEMKQTS